MNLPIFCYVLLPEAQRNSRNLATSSTMHIPLRPPSCPTGQQMHQAAAAGWDRHAPRARVPPLNTAKSHTEHSPSAKLHFDFELEECQQGNHKCFLSGRLN